MTENEQIISHDLHTSFLENLDVGVPLLYLCCRKCAGLFCSEETFSIHAPSCAGDPYHCNTEYFACQREKFYSFYLDLWKTLNQKTAFLHQDNVNDNEEFNCLSLTKNDEYTDSSISTTIKTETKSTNIKNKTFSESLKCVEENPIVAGTDAHHFDIDVSDDLMQLTLPTEKNKTETDVNNFTYTEEFSQRPEQLSSPTVHCKISGEISSGEISSGEISSGEISSGEISSGEISSGDLIRAAHNEITSIHRDVGDITNNNNQTQVNNEDTSLLCVDAANITNGNNNNHKARAEELLDDEVYTMEVNNRSEDGILKSYEPYGPHEELSPKEVLEQCSKLLSDGHDVYKCNLCGYESRHVGFMQRHLGAHNNGQVFKCNFCTFTCYMKSRLLLHMQCHRDEVLVCDVCSATFRHRSTMKRHIDIKHKGESRHMCNTCGYLAASNSGLMDHIRKHTGHLLQCDVVGCTFQTAYKRSLVLHHEKHEGIQRYVCDVCGYRTSESGSLQKHLSIHKGKKPFKCPHCSYRAVAHHDVVKHARAKHLRQKKYCCNKCNFSTGYLSSLTNHLMVHAGIKPYKCSYCTYQSNMAAKVTRHMQQRHPLEHCYVIKLDIPFEYNVKDFVNKAVSSSLEVQVIKLSEEYITDEHAVKSPDPPPCSESYLPNTSYDMSSFKPCSDDISISVPENDSGHLLDESDNNIFNHCDSAVFGSSAYKLLSQSTDDIRSDGIQRCMLKPTYRHGVYRRSSSVCSEPMLSSYRAMSDVDPDSCSMDATDYDVKDTVETSHLIEESDEVMQETRHLIGVSHGSIQSTDHLIGGATVLTTYPCNF